MSRLLVIGGQGVLGTFVARLFAAQGWEVLRAGRRPEQAADFISLDLDDSAALSAACGEADVIVNTAHHPGLAPEQTVIRDGGLLIDLVELSAQEGERLRVEEPEARGLVLTNTGLGGVSYLAIAELLRAHPEATEAAYSLMFSASGSSGRAGALLAHTLLSACSHFLTAKLPFPSPLGARRCIEVGVGGGVLRDALDGVSLRTYLCMQPRSLHELLLALNGLRLISRLPAATFTAGTGKVPAELSEEPICEWLSVGVPGRRLAAQSVEGRGYYRMTAAATLAFAEALVASAPEQRGLLSLDQVLTLDAVRPGIEAGGITLRDQPLAP